jgi:hypothetical protein
LGIRKLARTTELNNFNCKKRNRVPEFTNQTYPFKGVMRILTLSLWNKENPSIREAFSKGI